MDSFKIITLVALLFGTFISNVKCDNRVRVTVYYESYCPYSKAFITNQLIPTYKAIGSIMNIEMIPTSLLLNENDHTTAKFKCQHGPLECSANLIQTCAQQVYGMNDPRVLNMIFCMESSQLVLESSPTCASQSGLNYATIRACSVDHASLEYLLANSIKRFSLTNPPLPYFPWITFDGETNTVLQKLIRENLLESVCNAYTGVKPKACSTSG